MESPFDTRPWSDPHAEPFIRIDGISKHFGDFVAVDGVDLDIYQGELFAILGGSGCGKTTLLRMMAGFETPTSGRIWIDGVDVTDQPPYQRPVNLMFQSYALFPHMNVRKNVAYGLRKDGVPKKEIDERVDEMLGLVQLRDFARRRPHQLSGGQRQRVALARALVKKPKVLLLDEPLAALDKKLREQTQFELAQIQEELGITFMIVTHDQEEAMTLATRIAVMDEGRVMQVGTPKEVYEYPTSRIVADFIGTINQFEGRIRSVADGVATVAVDGRELQAGSQLALAEGDAVCVAVRPEKMYISKSAPEDSDRAVLKGVVLDLGYFGNLSLYKVALDGGKIVLVSAQNRHRSAERFLEWDDEVYVSWDTNSAVLLNA